MGASYESTLRTVSIDADSTLAILTGPPGAAGSLTGVNSAGNQYRAVIITGAHQAGVANAANAAPVGILQNKPQYAGNAATVAFSGVSKVKVSTNVVAGAVVYLAADGTGSNASTNASVIGTALDTSTVAGALVPVLLKLGE